MNNAMTQTLTVRGREFTVSREGDKYVLTGKRGARYATMRNANTPTNMFLVDCRGFGMASGFDGCWLSDADGTLRVVRP